MAALRPSDSPRLAGEDCEHARVLAETDAVLPPVLVHRPTMRVIDGMHRLQAAVLRGEESIRVRFFDGDAADAFVLGVRANVDHGMPLTLPDRRAAALRIITSHPQWSDRAIASATGLAAKTVCAIRTCASGDDPQSLSRVGRDGRTRPLNSADGRLRASALLREKPATSLRQIAVQAGVSLGTVRDVRDRLARGDDPVPPRQRRALRAAEAKPSPAPGRCADRVEEQRTLLVQLKRDPSLRFTETGRSLIRLLSAQLLDELGRKQVLDSVPAHCRGIVAELAQSYAEMWNELAMWLDRGVPAES
ncbi:ParB/RepB/Spo0J family partition protein [Actinosynnema sp. NPDC023587]|uniref:ParB/RepB/Spo0J family partition protein n=1 Tax=Actinosynnema sp. NPDC023587 TaxID=3154695 RepID=UPI0033E4BDDB